MDFNHLLQGKTAFITTGARGIGKSIAQLFARQGGTVIVGGRNEARLKETVDELRRTAPDSKGYSVDLSKEQEVLETADRIRSEFGGIDILVNTVGINTHSPVHTCEADMIYHTLQTNYVNGLLLAKAFIPGMLERRAGAIINISSIHASMTMPGFGIYAGSKGAMEATARAMALDYAPYGIRVNNIAPGLILSDVMMDEIHTYPKGPKRDAFMEMLTAMQPLKPGHMEDVACAALYLASDMSSYITGQTIFVDGGASIKAH